MSTDCFAKMVISLIFGAEVIPKSPDYILDLIII